MTRTTKKQKTCYVYVRGIRVRILAKDRAEFEKLERKTLQKDWNQNQLD